MKTMTNPYENKVCRCISTPENTSFEPGTLYLWTYCIDGYAAIDNAGRHWSAGEIEFYCYFQILSGKEYK